MSVTSYCPHWIWLFFHSGYKNNPHLPWKDMTEDSHREWLLHHCSLLPCQQFAPRILFCLVPLFLSPDPSLTHTHTHNKANGGQVQVQSILNVINQNSTEYFLPRLELKSLPKGCIVQTKLGGSIIWKCTCTAARPGELPRASPGLVFVCVCVLMCAYELIGCSQCMSFLFLIFSIKTITPMRPGSRSSCAPYAQRSSVSCCVISWSLLDVYNILSSCCSKTTFCSLFSVTFMYTCHVALYSSSHCRFHRLHFEDKPTYIQDLVQQFRSQCRFDLISMQTQMFGISNSL